MEILLIAGLILAVILLLSCVITFFWLVVIAFRVSLLWGLGSLLIPGVQIIFIVLHWEESKRPAIIAIASYILVLGLKVLLTPLYEEDIAKDDSVVPSFLSEESRSDAEPAVVAKAPASPTPPVPTQQAAPAVTPQPVTQAPAVPAPPMPIQTAPVAQQPQAGSTAIPQPVPAQPMSTLAAPVNMQPQALNQPAAVPATPVTSPTVEQAATQNTPAPVNPLSEASKNIDETIAPEDEMMQAEPGMSAESANQAPSENGAPVDSAALAKSPHVKHTRKKVHHKKHRPSDLRYCLNYGSIYAIARCATK